jgi:hypothetical protein
LKNDDDDDFNLWIGLSFLRFIFILLVSLNSFFQRVKLLFI